MCLQAVLHAQLSIVSPLESSKTQPDPSSPQFLKSTGCTTVKHGLESPLTTLVKTNNGNSGNNKFFKFFIILILLRLI
jgi:hypothetical protein